MCSEINSANLAVEADIVLVHAKKKQMVKLTIGTSLAIHSLRIVLEIENP